VVMVSPTVMVSSGDRDRLAHMAVTMTVASLTWMTAVI